MAVNALREQYLANIILNVRSGGEGDEQWRDCIRHCGVHNRTTQRHVSDAADDIRHRAAFDALKIDVTFAVNVAPLVN